MAHRVFGRHPAPGPPAQLAMESLVVTPTAAGAAYPSRKRIKTRRARRDGAPRRDNSLPGDSMHVRQSAEAMSQPMSAGSMSQPMSMSLTNSLPANQSMSLSMTEHPPGLEDAPGGALDGDEIPRAPPPFKQEQAGISGGISVPTMPSPASTPLDMTTSEQELLPTELPTPAPQPDEQTKSLQTALIVIAILFVLGAFAVIFVYRQKLSLRRRQQEEREEERRSRRSKGSKSSSERGSAGSKKSSKSSSERRSAGRKSSKSSDESGAPKTPDPESGGLEESIPTPRLGEIEKVTAWQSNDPSLEPEFVPVLVDTSEDGSAERADLEPSYDEVSGDPTDSGQVDIEGTVKQLEEERRQELLVLMRDHSLKKAERKEAMHGVRKRYDGLIADAREGKLSGRAGAVTRLSQLDITGEGGGNGGEDDESDGNESDKENQPVDGTTKAIAATAVSIDDDNDNDNAPIKAEILSLAEEINAMGNADELEALRFHLRATKARIQGRNAPAAVVSDVSESDPSSHPSDPLSSDPTSTETLDESETHAPADVNTSVSSDTFIGTVNEVSKAERNVLWKLLGYPDAGAPPDEHEEPDPTEDEQADASPHIDDPHIDDAWRESFRNDLRNGIEAMCAVHRQMLEAQVMKAAPPGDAKDEYYAAVARAAAKRAEVEAKKLEVEARRAELELKRLELELSKVDDEVEELTPALPEPASF